MDKTEWATLQIIFLGILLNCQSMQLAIPLDKKFKATTLLQEMIKKKNATVKEIQTLCGVLNFLNKAVFPGRVFTCRMYAKFAQVMELPSGHTKYKKTLNLDAPQSLGFKLKLHHHVRVDNEFKANYRVWLQFLSMESTVNRPMIDLLESDETYSTISFYSDASRAETLGYGCIYNEKWIYGQWEPGFVKDFHLRIEYLELFALCAGVFTWETHLQNRRVQIFCDNVAVVAMVNNTTSSCKNCMFLLRLLVLNNLKCNRRITVRFISMKRNVLADTLSRGKIDVFKKLAPWVNIFPDTVPDSVLAFIKIVAILIVCYFHIGKRSTKKSTKAKTNDSASPSSGASTISTYDMKLIVEKLHNQKHRDSTKKNYYTVWKLFNQFFLKLDRKPASWDEIIVLFIGYLVDSKKQSSTVKSYISAVKAVLQDTGIRVNYDYTLISSLTKACHLINDQIQTRLPIQKSLLSVILKTASDYFLDNGQMYLRSLYIALFSTVYFGLFRVGELTTGTHPVLDCDVHIGHNKRKFMFILRTSKTHWKDAPPQVIKIKSSNTNQTRKAHKDVIPEFCLYSLLRNYLNSRGPYSDSTEPFFIFADNSPVTPAHMRNGLKKFLQMAKFQPELYSVHSLRMGRALDLLKIGLSVKTIKKIGR